jgi:parvulin-like peptidyl-prolyl isomerase
LRRITAETMLVRQYMETVLLAGITITDEDLKAYYDEHPSEFRHSEQLKLKMILIEAKPTADETTRAAARAKAESVHKRLLAGEDFATLAEQFSEDPTRSAGGEIGWVGKDRLLAEIEPAVFAIPTGKISGVLVSSYGYHIFKVEDRKPAGASTLAEVKESLRGFLRGRRMESTVRAKVDTLRAGAKIVYLDPALEATLLGKPAPAGPGK